MFGSRAAMPAFVLVAFVFAAIPIAVAIDDDTIDAYDLVTVRGEVTAFLYDEDEYEDYAEPPEDVVAETMDDEDDASCERLRAFVIDNETIVTFGPWWYWMYLEFNWTDFLHIGDTVNVTGCLETEDGVDVLSAWYVGNESTGEELTIKEEGRPPWAGGPKALGIDPWPPSKGE